MHSHLHRPRGRYLRQHLCCEQCLDVSFGTLSFHAHSFIPSSYQLAVVNSNVIDPACDNLVPGESICLGWEGEDCTDTYVVNLGDDCDDVAYAFNLNSTIFNANNPQLNEDCTNMYIGEVSFSASPLYLKCLML